MVTAVSGEPESGSGPLTECQGPHTMAIWNVFLAGDLGPSWGRPMAVGGVMGVDFRNSAALFPSVLPFLWCGISAPHNPNRCKKLDDRARQPSPTGPRHLGAIPKAGSKVPVL